jgi:hypothetical protein
MTGRPLTKVLSELSRVVAKALDANRTRPFFNSLVSELPGGLDAAILSLMAGKDTGTALANIITSARRSPTTTLLAGGLSVEARADIERLVDDANAAATFTRSQRALIRKLGADPSAVARYHAKQRQGV